MELTKGMLPFNEMVDDPGHQELDRLLLSKVLGFEENTHQKMHEGLVLLRAKLCKEPSIHGGTDQKCDLEAEARELKLQTENPDPVQGDLFP